MRYTFSGRVHDHRQANVVGPGADRSTPGGLELWGSLGVAIIAGALIYTLLAARRLVYESPGPTRRVSRND